MPGGATPSKVMLRCRAGRTSSWGVSGALLVAGAETALGGGGSELATEPRNGFIPTRVCFIRATPTGAAATGLGTAASPGVPALASPLATGPPPAAGSGCGSASSSQLGRKRSASRSASSVLGGPALGGRSFGLFAIPRSARLAPGLRPVQLMVKTIAAVALTGGADCRARARVGIHRRCR